MVCSSHAVGTVCPPMDTVTDAPAGTNPHTVACAGACCNTWRSHWEHDGNVIDFIA